MHRCLIEPHAWDAHPITPSPEAAHHLLHVCRVRVGDAVEVFDGLGRRCPAQVTGIRPTGNRGQRNETPVLELTGQPVFAERPLPRVTLLQALPKGKRMDVLVEKAAELGAAWIAPILTERTVLRLTPTQRRDRRQRWERISWGAARQCNSEWITEIGEVAEFSEALSAMSPSSRGHFLLGSLQPGVVPLREAMQTARAERPAEITVLIGPEGDLTPAETEAAVAAGAQPVTFGERVLRVETAAIYALSVIAYELFATEPPRPGSR